MRTRDNSRRKGVTILERGTTSTRWRDYVDIVRLAEEHGLDQDRIPEAVIAVAQYRAVELVPITDVVAGYGEIGQAKWAAWRRKENTEDVTEADLDAQMARVTAVLDRAFSTSPNDADLTEPLTNTLTQAATTPPRPETSGPALPR